MSKVVSLVRRGGNLSYRRKWDKAVRRVQFNLLSILSNHAYPIYLDIPYTLIAFQIIVFAILFVAVALAMQPLDEDNDRNHHLNHKRQLSQHHHKDLLAERHHSASNGPKEHHKQGKNLAHLAAYKTHAKSKRTGRTAHSEFGHSKSHQQKQRHQKDHFSSRKARSHSTHSKHHHKRHAGSRHH